MNKFKMTWLFVIFVIIGVAIGYLATDIAEKKAEEKHPFFNVVEIGPLTEDPAIWGRNYPFQYESYLKTVDMVRTRHGGSEAVPQVPSEADPRSYVAKSKLEDERLKTIWAGYPFAIDNRKKRGHAYMLLDQIHTERVKVTAQPGTCLNCHASTYVTMMKLGDGDLFKGFEVMNQSPYEKVSKMVSHPVSCIDCHDTQTMALRITRPAFIEGIREYKKSQGVTRYDVQTDATRQEMRTFVCAQCHVEYYFKGKEKRLVYPWSEGIRADDMLAYYEKNPHTDWVHEKTGTKALKAQHPEFEMWTQGAHAKAGVSCVDCHMPYERKGAMKVTNHHVRSPLLNVKNACLTCHQVSEDEMLERVHLIQSRHLEMRDKVMDALVELINDLEQARKNGLSEKSLAQAQQLHREAQFIIDYVEAENSGGFHAPQEAARIMVLSLDKIRKAQNLIQRK